MGDFLAAFDGGQLDGTVESGAVLAWRIIRDRMPRAKLVTVRRPLADVYDSLAKFGLRPMPGELETKDELLNVLEALPSVRRFEFAELGDRLVACDLFQHCLELPFDEEWWAGWERTNVQLDMQARLDRLRENGPQLQALKIQIAELLETAPCLGLN